MRVAAITLGVVILAVALVVGVGYLIPMRHNVSREIELPAPPASVFSAIASPADFHNWRRGIQRVEILSPDSGRVHFREIGKDRSIEFVFEEQEAGKRLVARIADKSLPFGGKWTYDLRPTGRGTVLRITEDGKIYNPIYRFVSRFVLGYHRTIDTYFNDLKEHIRSAGQS